LFKHEAGHADNGFPNMMLLACVKEFKQIESVFTHITHRDW